MQFPVKSAHSVMNKGSRSAPAAYQPCPAREVVQARMQFAGSQAKPGSGGADMNGKPPAFHAPPVYSPYAPPIPANRFSGGIAQKPAQPMAPASRVVAGPRVAATQPRVTYDRLNQASRIGQRLLGPVQSKTAFLKTPTANPPNPYRPPKAGGVASARQSPAGPIAQMARVAAPVLQRDLRAQPFAPVVQRYQVLTGDKILPQMPTERPWFGYPYAVLHGAQFPAQVPGQNNDFLTTQRVGGRRGRRGRVVTVANVVNHDGNGLSLRVSDDCNMAIEDTDLTGRQPKEFYATQAVITDANTLLGRGNSRFSLEAREHRLTILTGWSGTKNLLRVVPRYDGNSANNAPQNCNAIAAAVVGMTSDGLSAEGETAGLDTALRIAGLPGGRDDEGWLAAVRDLNNTEQDLMDAVARNYVRGKNRYQERVRTTGANQYAKPEVGDAFAIVTMGYGQVVNPGRRTVRVRDVESGLDRTMDWNYHFGGVVARSGNDRITLENYARGDNRMNNADPRWYFQMYGEKQGQSFHEFYSAKPDYANPVTISQRNPNRVEVPVPSRWQPVWDFLEIVAPG